MPEAVTPSYNRYPFDVDNEGKRMRTNRKDIDIPSDADGGMDSDQTAVTVHEQVTNLADPIDDIQARVREGEPTSSDAGVVTRPLAGRHDRTSNKTLLLILMELRKLNQNLMRRSF